jgi:hypothetical protein
MVRIRFAALSPVRPFSLVKAFFLVRTRAFDDSLFYLVRIFF